ncbi:MULTISPECIES: hypothetical protein [Pyrobaculum]|uniref:Uncharacterized protein n=1 Tax=Pyrobaculum aerophilum TaxID=13773 RepID=A0A832W5A3_9CREN|nr:MULTISPECIES: hypothetical protein [Pyrobaculum]MCX8136789.1 hypothetical protein [Pyrobaculum aerophilum]HII47799.1 hypothetical protein [Pyrobaculum aerophilum]
MPTARWLPRQLIAKRMADLTTLRDIKAVDPEVRREVLPEGGQVGANSRGGRRL